MDKGTDFYLNKSLKILLLFLAGLAILFVLLFNVRQPRKRSNKSDAPLANSKNILSKNKAAVVRFWHKKIALKTIGHFKVPVGMIYELRSLDKKLYFQVERKTNKVTYASIGDISFRETSEAVINRPDARKIALNFARSHSGEFKGFSLDAKQADYYWPKPTYWTFIWHYRPTSSKNVKFAKVTVDAVTGKVVSFGIGDKDWASFCLPDKKQAPWAGK